jgi:hypothetical protein
MPARYNPTQYRDHFWQNKAKMSSDFNSASEGILLRSWLAYRWLLKGISGCGGREPYRRKKLALERVENPAKSKIPGSTSCE